MEKFTIRIPEEFTIRIPDGYEIDKKNSNSECIKFKPKGIKTWNDLYVASLNSNEVRVSGYRIDHYSNIYEANRRAIAGDHSRNLFLTEKEAKSSLAMSQISQLMPYYGGSITDGEWEDSDIIKYAITRYEGTIVFSEAVCWFHFLAFHTEEQRDSFYKNNEQLVKDYLMID